MVRRTVIEFAESAVGDLEDILAWYADQQIPEVGKRLVREVVSQVERLADFPESGRIVPEFGLTKLREIIYPPFRIVYRIEAAHIWIIRVWRSERLLKLPGNLE
ncbi:type II toxin-antitoxin system RelE/ParE family toxin [Pelotalea chapellei]|uniref:Type II toxin-antitoxin system RelE/ParE family toxin n=1 Tax=Pelotalea chapellei TaxID=44671 RepID=A0ABS5UAW0_9BACT|nr:type II toxin-antitoxin system RelE/ParE family toxin [Pelotalea chapellei]MBT1072790.1 type II toxin-antitoxin system RelE/ParE family toxin [Pelotalea chapellei]